MVRAVDVRASRRHSRAGQTAVAQRSCQATAVVITPARTRNTEQRRRADGASIEEAWDRSG